MAVSAFSKIVGLKFKPEEFDDQKYVIKYDPKKVDLLKPKPLESQTYNYALRDKNGKYEIRYILFKQTEKIPDFEKYKIQVALWSMMVVANITGDENGAEHTSVFKEADVMNEFNADYGFTNFYKNVKTDFSTGYKYLMINFYCKRDLGIMCQTILFNDLSWVKTNEFLWLFHSFKYSTAG